MGRREKRPCGETGAGCGSGFGPRSIPLGSWAYARRTRQRSTGRCVTAETEQRKSSGFTLIEIIGVLAVIAILASLLLPRIFKAINDARINHAAVATQTVKTACAEHFAKFGSFLVDGSVIPPEGILLDGTDARASQFDLVLLNESILESSFTVKIGFGYVEIVKGLASSETPTADNSAYNLDAGGFPNDASGTVVAQAVIVGVLLEDARALNNVIDGAALGEDKDGNDSLGRVKYAKPGKVKNGNADSSVNGNGNGHGNGNGTGKGKAWAWGHHRDDAADVFIYLSHR